MGSTKSKPKIFRYRNINKFNSVVNMVKVKYEFEVNKRKCVFIEHEFNSLIGPEPCIIIEGKLNSGIVRLREEILKVIGALEIHEQSN